MYAIFIRFMFGCKHSTKGVIEFRIMAWDAQLCTVRHLCPNWSHHISVKLLLFFQCHLSETPRYPFRPDYSEIHTRQIFDSKFGNNLRKNLITTVNFNQELILFSFSNTVLFQKNLGFLKIVLWQLSTLFRVDSRIDNELCSFFQVRLFQPGKSWAGIHVNSAIG